MARSNKISFKEHDLDSVVAACIAKDQLAQRALIKQFYGYAMSICLRYASGNEEAEEMLNDGFLKMFNNLPYYDHIVSFKAWLRKLMVNTAIDHYRKNQKHQHLDDVMEMDMADVSEDVISKISAQEILSLVQQLTPAYRMVFTLYVVDGHTHKEIAEMLGIKEGTSKSNLMDARRKLQGMVRKLYPQLNLAYAVNFNKINEN